MKRKEKEKEKEMEKEEKEKGKNEYEKVREEIIRKNKERMQKLGLFQLSQNLTSSSKPKRTTKILPSNPPQQYPLRRSPRLENIKPVSYKDTPVTVTISVKRDEKLEGKMLDLPALTIQECQTEEEIYTREHVKLLGTHVSPWTLSQDGRHTDGSRIYDASKGNTCHQCRQKTLGCHTHCSKCRVFTGQLCGDCLYMRYGENVLEVNDNPNWICPVCRGICNCSVCRSKKGWPPTGSVYRKVSKMGFESVAHYLILTHQTKAGDLQVSAQPNSQKESLTFCGDGDTANKSTSESNVNGKKKSKVAKDSATVVPQRTKKKAKKVPSESNAVHQTEIACNRGMTIST